jgi:hypothetical protein
MGYDGSNPGLKSAISATRSGGKSVVNWEYTFFVSKVSEAGIKEIPSNEQNWDQNGYRRQNEDSNQRNTRQKVNIVNRYGQKGWELISITPITFRINGHEIGQTEELMFTFKKPVEQNEDPLDHTQGGNDDAHSSIQQPAF